MQAARVLGQWLNETAPPSQIAANDDHHVHVEYLQSRKGKHHKHKVHVRRQGAKSYVLACVIIEKLYLDIEGQTYLAKNNDLVEAHTTAANFLWGIWAIHVAKGS